MTYKGLDLYLNVQLKMDDWIKAGLPMLIDGVNFNQSNLLLSWLLDRPPMSRDMNPLNAEQISHCQLLLEPHGYTYYRMLTEQRGTFVLDEVNVSEWRRHDDRN